MSAPVDPPTPDAWVAAWRQTCADVLELVQGLDAEQWARPTDCPGWTVHDVVSHLAHLEVLFVGLDADPAPAADAPPPSPTLTEDGVQARRLQDPAAVVGELRHAVEVRSQQVPGDADPTLLRNRCLDLWVHEQDLRRALGRPGGFDGESACLVTQVMVSALPVVLGKRVAPPAHTTVAWHVTGPVTVELMLTVDEDGRARRVETSCGDITVLTMSTETFTMLGAGRGDPASLDVEVDGDADLARSVLAAMSITP